MRVRSFERYAAHGDFNPASGSIEMLSNETPSAEHVRGIFANLGPVPAILYRHHSKLWLRLGSDAFALDHDFKITWRRVSDGQWDDQLNLTKRAVSEVSMSSPQVPTVNIRYDSGVPYGPPLSMTPTQSDEEDWDFGLFVANVVCDSDRSTLIFTDESYEA